MAISATHFSILKELKSREILPQGGRILEIGEANWYGDVEWKTLFGETVEPPPAIEAGWNSFDAAKVIYRNLFGNDVQLVAIDLDPSRPAAHNLDLNNAIDLEAIGGPFDIAYNHGTAEHVFNIAQVFRTMHDATKTGGLLIHESPFTGWVDHGFYCLQPTLFWDVAAVNGYKMEFVAIEHLASRTWQEIPSREHLLEAKRRDQLADNLMLFVVMRKQSEAPFVVPMQGVYAGSVSKEAQSAWRELR